MQKKIEIETIEISFIVNKINPLLSIKKIINEGGRFYINILEDLENISSDYINSLEMILPNKGNSFNTIIKFSEINFKNVGCCQELGAVVFGEQNKSIYTTGVIVKALLELKAFVDGNSYVITD